MLSKIRLVVNPFMPSKRNILVYVSHLPMAQVHYCDHALSVVRPSVVRR